MALDRFYFSTGALLVLCAGLAVISNPTAAAANGSYKKLDKSIDRLFSLKELQCPSETKEKVKQCVHIAVDVKSFCLFTALYNHCMEEGYRQCANGYLEIDTVVKQGEKRLQDNGCSRRVSKREAISNVEAEKISKPEIMEDWINQLMPTFN